MSDILEHLRDFLIRQRPLLWCCHVRGPDDIHAWDSYESARNHADELNYGFASHFPFAPFISAAPMIWPLDAKSHAEDLAVNLAEQAEIASMRESKKETA